VRGIEEKEQKERKRKEKLQVNTSLVIGGN